jgi:hypothetical protein
MLTTLIFSSLIETLVYFGVFFFNQVLTIYNFKKIWFLGLQKQMSMVIIIILMSKICEQTTSKIVHVQGLWFNNLFI